MVKAGSKDNRGWRQYLVVAAVLIVAAFLVVACNGYDAQVESADQSAAALQGDALSMDEFLAFQEKVSEGCYVFEGDVMVCNEEELKKRYIAFGVSGYLTT